MRETRLSGSEGGAGPVTRPRPYPYHRRWSTLEARAARRSEPQRVWLRPRMGSDELRSGVAAAVAADTNESLSATTGD